MEEKERSICTFSTAMLGFKKADVLSYIEELTAENLTKEQGYQAQLQELEASVSSLQQDKDTLLFKTREVCNRLTEQEELLHRAEDARDQMEQALGEATERADSCKEQLSRQTGSLEALTEENGRLKDSLEQSDRMQQSLAEQVKAEREQAEGRLREFGEQLQAEIESLRSDKETLLQRTKEVCQQLAEQEKRAEQAEGSSTALREELVQLHGLTKEQQEKLKEQEELVSRLRSGSARNADQIREQEEELTRLDAELSSAKKENEALTRRLRTAEEQAARHAKPQPAQMRYSAAEAGAEELQARERLSAGAQQLAVGVDALKAQLADVDARVAEAVRQLQQATAVVHTALNQTERQVKELGAQVTEFPDNRPPAPNVQEKTQVREIPHANRVHVQKKTLSDRLLDRLSGMMHGE